jgi:uncharacterized protein (TIGR02271 family)
MPRAPSDRTDTQSIPLHEEVADVAKRTVEHRARVEKRVNTRVETVETTLRREHPVVERVAINRTVEQAPPVRQEGDTLVIPVVEEIAVVERRLVLREEIRIRRQETVEPFRQDVTLRAEEVVIEPAQREAATDPSTHLKHRKED